MAHALRRDDADSSFYSARPLSSTPTSLCHLGFSSPVHSKCSPLSGACSSLSTLSGHPAMPFSVTAESDCHRAHSSPQAPSSPRSSVCSLTPSIEFPRSTRLPLWSRSHRASKLRESGPLTHRRASSTPATSSKLSAVTRDATRACGRPSVTALGGGVGARPSASHHSKHESSVTEADRNLLEAASCETEDDSEILSAHDKAESADKQGATLIRAVSGDIVAEYDKKWTAERIRVDLAARWKTLCPFVILIDLSQAGIEIHDSTKVLPDEVVSVLLNKTDLSFHEWINVIHRHAKFQDKAGVQRAVAALRSTPEQRDAPIGEALCVRDVMRRCFCDAIAHRDDVTSHFTPLGAQATDGTHARCPTVDVDDTQKVAAHWAMKQRECYVDLLCESMEEEVVAMVTQVGRQEPLLFEACAQGDFVLVASLLKHCRRYQDVSLNTKSEAGHSPLILATIANAGSTVRLLIEAKADANMKGLYGRSSLLIAAHRGYRDIVKILITEFSSLVDVNVEDRHAQTPLLAAAFHGFDDIVADLLKAGAQVRVDNHGNDPYMLAKQRRQWSIVSLLERARPLQCSNKTY